MDIQTKHKLLDLQEAINGRRDIAIEILDKEFEAAVHNLRADLQKKKKEIRTRFKESYIREKTAFLMNETEITETTGDE